jgi:hypothetical protein
VRKVLSGGQGHAQALQQPECLRAQLLALELASKAHYLLAVRLGTELGEPGLGKFAGSGGVGPNLASRGRGIYRRTSAIILAAMNIGPFRFGMAIGWR